MFGPVWAGQTRASFLVVVVRGSGSYTLLACLAVFLWLLHAVHMQVHSSDSFLCLVVGARPFLSWLLSPPLLCPALLDGRLYDVTFCFTPFLIFYSCSGLYLLHCGDEQAPMAKSLPMRCSGFSWLRPKQPARGGRATCNVDVGGAKYELVLFDNKTVDMCAENVALSALLNCSPTDEIWGTPMDQTRKSCVKLFEAYRSLWMLPPEEVETALQAVPDFYLAAPVKRQLKTVGGEVVCCPPDPKSRVPVDNPCGPEVPVFAKKDLKIVAGVARHVFKVVLPDGSVCCDKEVYRCDPIDFKYEATMLAGLRPHPNVVALRGVVATEIGKIDGLLLTWMDGVLLSSLTSASAASVTKWKEQLTSALDHLHGHKLAGNTSDTEPKSRTWGDAKPHNIFINGGELVIIDFGGMYTDGWVDEDKAGTEAGDNQGKEKIFSWLDDLVDYH